MENCPFIDGLPIKNGDFLIAMLNYQKVMWKVNYVKMQWLWRHPSFRQSHLRLVFSGSRNANLIACREKHGAWSPGLLHSQLGIYVVQMFNIAITFPTWWFQPLWKILVSCDYYSQYMESYKIPWFQSPPTRYGDAPNCLRIIPIPSTRIENCFPSVTQPPKRYWWWFPRNKPKR